MGTLTLETGKGFKSTISPYKELVIFGHEFYAWNPADCPGQVTILGPTGIFNFQGITPYHEAVALLTVHTAGVTGRYTLSQKWFRQRDGQQVIPRPGIPEQLIYAYDILRGYQQQYVSWAGWLPEELWENGEYRVDVTVAGPESLTGSIHFLVVGAQYEPPAPVVGGAGLVALAEAFRQAADFCWQVHLAAQDWIWPFSGISYPFFSLYWLFVEAYWAVGEFNAWITEVANMVTQGLGWDSIKALILSTFPMLESLLSWAENGWMNIWNEVEIWWGWTQQRVRGWIAVATEGLSSLRGNWDTFVSTTLPGLVNWQLLTDWWTTALGDVARMVDSAFTVRNGLWSGWSELRDRVAELFQDPEKWLVDKIESMIVRFW